MVAPEVLDKVGEELRLDEVRVKLGDAVDLVRPDDGEVRHAHALGRALLDEAHAREARAVVGEPALHVLEEVEVDLVDELEVAREEPADELYRPLLQRLNHDGMVSVRECALDDRPGDVPVLAFLVDEDAHELGDGDRRVGVV